MSDSSKEECNKCELPIMSTHMLKELDRFADKQDRIYERIIEQNETLIRNTVSLEEHVKRTNLLEDKVSHVEKDLGKVNSHIAKVETLIDVFKPTKQKIKLLIILIGLLGGSYGGYRLKDQSFSKIIHVIEKSLK